LGKSLYLDEPSTKGEINSDSEEKENSLGPQIRFPRDFSAALIEAIHQLQADSTRVLWIEEKRSFGSRN